MTLRGVLASSLVLLAACAAPPAVPSPSTPAEGLGRITGTLGYPSDQIPPLAVFAIRADTGAIRYHVVRTAAQAVSYAIDVEPGVYFVVAYPETDAGSLAGAYTAAVPCGLVASCGDHQLIAVSVPAGATVSGADVKDWYAAPGSFPPRPDR